MSAKFVPRKKGSVRLALFVLSFVGLVLFLGQVIRFSRTLLNPWKENPATVSKNYRWDGAYNINIVLHNKYVSVLSFNPSLKTITLLILPDSAYLDVAHGFGKWQLGSIYNLGQASSFGGESLLKETLSQVLGIPIDGYIQFNSNLQGKEPSALLDYLRAGPLNILDIISKAKTDLSLWELIKLKIDLSYVRFDKIKIIDFAKDNILQAMPLADGTDVFAADTGRIDSILSDFADPKIRTEALTVALYNATGHPLLAQKAARMITNIGGNVIITGNSEVKSEKTYIGGVKSETLKRLMQIFNCDKITANGFDPVSSRAQINIILGEDYYRLQF